MLGPITPPPRSSATELRNPSATGLPQRTPIRTDGTDGRTNERVVAAERSSLGPNARRARTGISADEIVIDADQWHFATEDYRDQCRAWLRANGIDPDVTVVEDIETYLVDAPFIAYTEYVMDATNGCKKVHWATHEPVTRRVHSLLRVPFPDNLRRPW